MLLYCCWLDNDNYVVGVVIAWMGGMGHFCNKRDMIQHDMAYCIAIEEDRNNYNIDKDKDKDIASYCCNLYTMGRETNGNYLY